MNNQINLHHSPGIISKLHQRTVPLLSVMQSLAGSWTFGKVLLLLLWIPFLMDSGVFLQLKLHVSHDTNHSVQKKLESLYVDSVESRQALSRLLTISENIDFSFFRNNSFLFKKEFIDPSLRDLAHIILENENSLGIYCRSNFEHHQNVEVISSDNDVPPISNSRKRNSMSSIIFDENSNEPCFQKLPLKRYLVAMTPSSLSRIDKSMEETQKEKITATSSVSHVNSEM